MQGSQELNTKSVSGTVCKPAVSISVLKHKVGFPQFLSGQNWNSPLVSLIQIVCLPVWIHHFHVACQPEPSSMDHTELLDVLRNWTMDNFVMWKKRKYSFGVTEVMLEYETVGSKARVWSKEKLNCFMLFYFSKLITRFLNLLGSAKHLKAKEAFFPHLKTRAVLDSVCVCFCQKSFLG